MNQPDLGRLEQVTDLRAYWQGEASHFTPWLAQPDNMAILGETLALELEVRSAEEAVGTFRADIVCTDLNDPSHVVLIENQLERTDHSHLGQIITYAAGIDAATIIWVARRFAEEHRAALDWLNQHTTQHLNFFGVEIELWRIGGSLAAPRFNVVSRPNDFQRAATTSMETQTTAGQTMQLAYWTAFGEYALDHQHGRFARKAQKQNWMSYGIGRGGVWLVAVAARADPLSLHQFDHLRVELLLWDESAASYMSQIQERQAEIEEKLGAQLLWHYTEGVKQRRAYIMTPAPVQEQDDWPNQFQWLLQHLARFDSVFRPIVATLNADGAVLPIASDHHA